MIIFWHATGPRIRYVGEVLYIDDLNPENHIKWRMGRWEMDRALQLLANEPARRPNEGRLERRRRGGWEK